MKPCKNPLNMYPHYILQSSSISGRVMDFYQYCGVCRKLAFQENNFGARQDINKNILFKQCEIDSL